MGAAENAMGGSYGAREFGPNDWTSARWRRGGSRWTAFESSRWFLASSSFGRSVSRSLATSSGKAGTAGRICRRWRPANGRCAHQDVRQLFFLGLRRHESCEPRLRRHRPATPLSLNGGRAELTRLDEERRKLDEAQREFAEYVDAIRRAKDREEFDRFMAERRARPASGGSEAR